MYQCYALASRQLSKVVPDRRKSSPDEKCAPPQQRRITLDEHTSPAAESIRVRYNRKLSTFEQVDRTIIY